MQTYDLLLLLPVLLMSIVLHEYAHARVAVGQGDSTPLLLGRVTLNPVRHIDPVGTVLVPLLLWFSGTGFLFGWAKPVPVNPRNFTDYRRGDILVSLAGVAANFLLAIAFLLFAVALTLVDGSGGQSPGVLSSLQRMAEFGIFINLLLGIFNLIPIPPLDGSHVLYHLLPPELGARYRALGRYSIVFLVLLLVVPGLLNTLLSPVRFLMGVAQELIGSVA